MASTSLILMSSDKNKSMKPPPALCASSQQQPHQKTTTTTEPSRSSNNRGRKSNNNNGKGHNHPKKTPQRGMGVAQLESILRDQEKMNNNIHISSPSPSSSVITHHLLSPTPGNVPLHYASPPNHGPLLHPPPPPMMMLNGNVVIPGGSGHGQGPIPPGFGAPTSWNSPLVVGCPLLETSRELSSMPNVIPHPESHHCDLCFKKKRLTTEDNNNSILRGSNTRRDTALWSLINNGPDHFLGFPPNHPAETTDFNIRMSSQNVRSYRNLDESVGVVAVHRKVGSNMSCGKIVMEYEFFPGKEDAMRDTNFKELGLSFEAKGYEASSYSITAAEASARARNINANTTTTDDAAAPAPAEPNSVDLCLRL